MSAVLQRIPDFVLKIGLIYAAMEKTSSINTEILNAAIDAGGYAAASAERIFAEFHESREVKLERRILAVLGEGVKTFGVLHRAVSGRYSTKALASVLEALVKSGQVWEKIEGKGRTYGLPGQTNGTNK